MKRLFFVSINVTVIFWIALCYGEFLNGFSSVRTIRAHMVEVIAPRNGHDVCKTVVLSRYNPLCLQLYKPLAPVRRPGLGEIVSLTAPLKHTTELLMCARTRVTGVPPLFPETTFLIIRVLGNAFG